MTCTFSFHGKILHIISLSNGLELLTVYAISEIIVKTLWCEKKPGKYDIDVRLAISESANMVVFLRGKYILHVVVVCGGEKLHVFSEYFGAIKPG